MDKIFLTELQVETTIGLFDWERRVRQSLSLDVEIGTDLRPAAAADDIDHTPDYAVLATRLREFVEGSSFRLIETLAERIAALVIAEFGAERVRVTLRKPGAVRGARHVGVSIERCAESGGA